MYTASTNYLNDGIFSQAKIDLAKFVAIPSVSHPKSPDYSLQQMKAAAVFAASKLKEHQFSVEYLTLGKSAPFVFAQRIIDPKLSTVLLYAHYDVQPVDRAKWNTDPFVLVEKNGRLYGRGAGDDKGGVIAIITAIKACIKAKSILPNIKVLFEGEEEIGSPNISQLLQSHSSKFKADALVVLDGMNKSTKCGSLTTSTRGLVNFEVIVQALEKPIHSGIGCVVPDPAQVLAGIVVKVRQPESIPGFMEGSQKLTEQEKDILVKSSISPEIYAKEMGMKPGVKLRGDSGKSVYERIVTEPSITVINMTSGILNGGNSIQDSARCTIGIRVLPGQDPDKVAQNMIQYLSSQELDSGMRITIKQKGAGCWAWKADLSNRFCILYFKSLEANFQSASVLPCGGALPLLREFQKMYPDMATIVPGVEDPSTDAHSHNESMDIGVFRRSIDSLIEFLKGAALLSKNEVRSRL